MLQKPVNGNYAQHSLAQVAASSSSPLMRLFAKTYKAYLYRELKRDIDPILTEFPTKNDFLAPKNPIVLCHGLSGFDKLILIPSVFQLTRIVNNFILGDRYEYFIEEDIDADTTKSIFEVEYWMGVKKKLEEKGCTVITSKVPGFGSIEERAVILNAFLERETKKLKETLSKGQVYNTEEVDSNASFKEEERIKLNLIAHSMGGLDCRYLISRIPNKSYKVISLTTVSTPHRGSEMADYVVALFEDLKQNAPFDTSKQILPASFYELTTQYMSYFNKITPDDPDVSYFSYGSYFEPKWYNAFVMPWKIIYTATNGQPNDGMVTVRSSKWGQYQGTLADTDHLDLINWKNKIQKDIGKLFDNTNHSAGKAVKPEIDILNFYLRIADDLARKGF
ncbi:hypothetical protein HG537_0B01200 [Torulaspora globosa]|uniref:DUF676 domain-containing protein n=1 Tax=Torulaspora globosa TaxID=48254 RepID=A0A7H9HNI6_9SACH|nr:hypothetical protein HG537_0B01200 [Torulaspora sp. CBS 2947]